MLGISSGHRTDVHEVNVNEFMRNAIIALVGVIGISASIQFIQATQFSGYESPRSGSYGASVYGR